MIIVLYGCILVDLHYKVQNKHEKTLIRENSFTLLIEYFWKYKVIF